MSNCKKEILVVAGEASGDNIGHDLIRELKSLYNPRIVSVGGEKMAKVSHEVLGRAEEVAVTGVFEVFGKLPKVLKLLLKVKRYLKSNRPSAVVLIDFPDFNFRVGRFAKKLGIKVFYYVSPQVWAWREGRVREIGEFSTRIFVIFPFEEEFYKKKGVEHVEYVGHPLVDRLKSVKPAEGRGYLALLPGSRKNEIERHLETMVEAAKEFKDYEPVVLLPKGLRVNSPIKVIYGKTLEFLASSELAVIASGTATLEAALLGVPGVVVYRLMWLSYALAKLMVKVNHVAMPNILLGKAVYPELIQRSFNKENLVQALKHVERKKDEIKRELSKIKAMLKDGASRRVAKRIGEELWEER